MDNPMDQVVEEKTKDAKQIARERMAKARKAAEQKRQERRAAKEAAPKTIDEPAKVQTVVTPTGMTQNEMAIYHKVMSESGEWKTVDQYATNDFSLSEDPFKLPEPAQKLQDNKQFKFRWITRTPDRLDEVKSARIPLRWWPVNRLQPVGGAFDKIVDGTTGAVHLLDQMLVFKPWWMWEKHQEYDAMLANTRGDLRAKDGEEKNDFVLSAARRKEGQPKTRTEISGSDLEMPGEADYDRATGRSDYTPASESDLAVNE